jgi:hypothetical protein
MSVDGAVREGIASCYLISVVRATSLTAPPTATNKQYAYYEQDKRMENSSFEPACEVRFRRDAEP